MTQSPPPDPGFHVSPETFKVSEPSAEVKQTGEVGKNFREQIIALGGAWIAIGILALVLAGLAAVGMSAGAGQALPLAWGMLAVAILAIEGIIWLTAGILTCMRITPAIYVGLAMSYLAIIGSAINLSICAVVLLAFVIFQGHRVLGFAAHLESRGISVQDV
jgi:hypothetical protein